MKTSKNRLWPSHLETLLAIEDQLGSPFDPKNMFSFEKAMQQDEKELYPEDPLQALFGLGLQEFLIPCQYGGGLKNLELVVHLIRLLARRDPTLALSYAMSFLGVVPIWISGSQLQIEQAMHILRGGGRISMGLTEQAHGSDLLANELCMQDEGTHWVLDGTKWLINHVSRGQAIHCFTRHTDKTGPRAYSFLFVQKNLLETGSFSVSDKITTLGMRGADMGGITFHGARVSKDYLVGKEGDGLEIMLKGFHITRSIAPCIALGGVDTAFRITAKFALERILYNKPVFLLPHARETLVRCFLNILFADGCSLFGVRILHHCPDKACLYGAMVKSFVPTLLEKVMQDLSVVLGARYYLRQEYCMGMFQKILRDIPVVKFGDGNTLVNLQAVLFYTKDIYKKPLPLESGRYEELFNLDSALPPADFRQLTLGFKGSEVILHAWSGCFEDMQKRHQGDPMLTAVLKTLDDQLKSICHQLAMRPGCPGYEEPYEYFTLAEKWCRLASLAIIALQHFYSFKSETSFFSSTAWLKLLLHMHLMPEVALPVQQVEEVAEEILERMHKNLFFGLYPLPVQWSE